MRVTPAYLDSVASFYDMLENHPVGRHSVYVCTNISCSLRGADALLAAIGEAAADDVEFNVRPFECLGACDIAPMASVNGEYVGPLQPADAEQIVDDLRAGRPVLEAKQLRYRRCADPGVAEGVGEFGPPAPETPRADTAGLGLEGDAVDRPGPSAPIEVPTGEEKPEPAADRKPDPDLGTQDAPDSPPRNAP
jgi:(2Fe-2S) ferredoxin